MRSVVDATQRFLYHQRRKLVLILQETEGEILGLAKRCKENYEVLAALNCESGSSVGVATDYGLDGPGSNPGGDEIFSPVLTGPGAYPASCKMGTGSFRGVKCGRGVLLTTHPLLVPRSWKSRAIPLSTLWATPGL